MPDALLNGWDNFYVIVGSSAVALTGLTFVVIALADNTRRVSAKGLRAFVTPTIVHFGTVLALAAYLTIPHQTVTSLGIGLGLVGAGGAIYSAVTGIAMRPRGMQYVPVFEDWIWHLVLPLCAYVAVLAMAFVVRQRPEPALYGVGGLSTALLFIGIHNAWDVATSITLPKPQDAPPDEAASGG